MESFPEKLRNLTHNRLFAVVAVIFFAFLTALVFALFALQNTTGTTGQPGSSAQQSVPAGGQDSSGGLNSGGGSATTPAAGTSSSKKPSVLDTIVAIITGKKPASTQQNQQGGTRPEQGTTTDGTGAGSESVIKRQTPLAQKINKGTGAVPKITIGRHVLVTELPAQPSSLTIHQLRNSYTTDEVKDLARNLGFSSIDGVETGKTLTQIYHTDSESILSFHPRTGRFTYLSGTGFRPTLPTSSMFQLGKNILTQIGIDHPAIKPTATYERSDDNADYVYIELHNDWQAFGGPIMNPIGMLNLQEDTDISSVTLGGLQKNPLENVNIVQTSDKSDGFARRDDFNTITIKYSPSQGKVYGISSNIPQVLQTESLTSDSIKTPVQAFNDFTSGKTTFATTGPSGEGSANLNDIYSNSLAQASSVDVTDAEIIYAAVPQNAPQWWCPVYVFRSFGKVQTGFEAQFVHTVPATTDARCQTAVLGSTTQLAQAAPVQTAPTGGVQVTPIIGRSGQDGSSLQYGTVEFIYQVVVDTPANECPVDFNHGYKIAETEVAIESMVWIDKNTAPKRLGQRGVIAREWYYLVQLKPNQNISLSEVSPSKSRTDLFKVKSQLMRTCDIGNPADCPVDQSLSSLQTVSCQYVTTGSPWVYVYPEAQQNVSISIDPVGGVSYVQPAFSHDLQWDFSAQPDGTLTFANGVDKKALHWEFYRQPVVEAYRAYTARTPQTNEGFVVPSDQVTTFIPELARRMGLNHTESQNLLAEFNRPSNLVQAPFTKISFIPMSFLDTYLPISVSPAPQHMQRIYLSVSPLHKYETLSAPSLPRVEHVPGTVLDIGVITVSNK